MGSKIPKVVREKVITEWLQGLSRDKIAVNNDIGGGTVTEIIKDYSENNSDVELQREFVVALMREGTDLNLYASSIRLKRFLERLEIDEERLDPFLVNVQEHCFKKNKETNDFIKSVNDACRVSNRMETSIEDLPEKLQEMKNDLYLLEKDIKQKKAEKAQVLMDCNITQSQLREARNSGLLGLAEKLRFAQLQIAALSRERYSLIGQVGLEKFANEDLASRLEKYRKKLYGDSNSSDIPHRRSV